MSGIPERPLLAPWYRLVGDGDRLLLEHAQVVVVLEGAAVGTLLPVLLPLLDGTRSIDELVERVGAPVRPAVEAALEVLASHGLLSEGAVAPAAVRATAHALAAGHGLAPREAVARLAGAEIAIVGNGSAASEIARLLHGAGIGAVQRAEWRQAPSAALTVAVPAEDELDALPGWNERALATGAVWMLVRPFDGRFAAVGPLVVPSESACYACLQLRRAANSEYGSDLDDVDGAPLAATCDSGVAALVGALAAHLVLRWTVGRDTTLPGVLHAVETRPAPAITRHHVLRVPRCPSCSHVERAAPPLPWHAAAA